MKSITIELSGEHFTDFIDRQIQTGRFGDASEVVAASLRLLEEREERVAAVRQALIDGEESGDAGPLDFDEIRQTARQRAGLDGQG